MLPPRDAQAHMRATDEMRGMWCHEIYRNFSINQNIEQLRQTTFSGSLVHETMFLFVCWTNVDSI